MAPPAATRTLQKPAGDLAFERTEFDAKASMPPIADDNVDDCGAPTVHFADERIRGVTMPVASPSAGGGASPLQGRRPVPIKPLAGGWLFVISYGFHSARLTRKRARKSGRCKTCRASTQSGTGEGRAA